MKREKRLVDEIYLRLTGVEYPEQPLEIKESNFELINSDNIFDVKKVYDFSFNYGYKVALRSDHTDEELDFHRLEVSRSFANYLYGDIPVKLYELWHKVSVQKGFDPRLNKYFDEIMADLII